MHYQKCDTPLTCWLAQRLLALLGWCVEGEILNAPRLVAVGAPHHSYRDMPLGFLLWSGLDIHVCGMVKHTVYR